LLGKIRESVEIDIGVGDLVDAQENTLKLMTGKGKPIFEDEISLLVYPLETILAEKLQTLVSRGEVNSRMKEYFDIVTLLKNINLEYTKVTDAIQGTFAYRQTDFKLLPIQFTDENVAKLQKYWSAFFEIFAKKTVLQVTSRTL
jgi:predicted nucleotidyltransferase component of viral defense system